MRNLQSFIHYMISNRARQKRNLMLTLTLSVIVLIAVSFILTKPADSMSGQLECTYEVHTHENSCYELICTQNEIQTQYTEITEATECTLEHEHDLSCLTSEPVITEPHTEHVHTAECYKLICSKEEHEHSQDCYKEEANQFISTFYNTDIEIMSDEIIPQEDVEHFTSVPNQLPSNSMNIFDYVVNNGTNLPTHIVSQGGAVEDNKDVTFEVSFYLSQAQIDIIKNGSTLENKNYNNYLYYKLPEGVTFKSEESGPLCLVTETISGKTYNIAHYAFSNNINGESYIVFRVLDDYITENFIKNNGSYLNMKILFDGIVSRDKTTNTGDRQIDLGANVKPIIEFNDYSAKIEKWGEYIKENNQGYIRWVITIKNPAPETKLTNGYYITDKMLANIVPDSLKVTPEGSIDTTTYKFLKEAPENNHTITIEYKTLVDKNVFYEETDENRKIKNTATMTDDTTTFTSNEHSVTVPKMAKIGKTIQKDYNLESGANIGKELYWNISLSTEFDEPLGGYAINDPALLSTMSNTISVKDQDGNAIDTSKYTLADGSITFADDLTATKINIVYKTSSEITTNTAQVIYPTADNKPGPTATATLYEYKPYKLEKEGSYKDGELTWVVRIKSNDNNVADISGLIFNDPALTRITSTDGVYDLKIEAYPKWSSTLTENFSYTEIKNAENKLTGLKFTTDTSKENPANNLVITFNAKPAGDEQDSLDLIQKTKFTNTADINQNNYTDWVYAETEYDPINKVEKKLVKPTEAFESWNLNESLKTRTLSWTVEMVQDTGFSSDSKAFIDIIQAYDKSTKAESTEAQHYVTHSQRTNIKVYAKANEEDSWPSNPLENTNNKYYTITYYTDTEGLIEASDTANAKSFKITFSADIDTAGYKAIKIDYDTTADMSNVVNPSTISFKNTAEFNDNEYTPKGYEVEIYNPDITPYTKNAVDMNNNVISDTTVNLSNVTKATIENVEYYIFAWRIDITSSVIGKNDNSKELTFIDQFEEGFTFCTDAPYTPTCVRYWGAIVTFTENESHYDNQYRYTYSKGSNTVRLTNIPLTKDDYITYYTKIPAETYKAKVLAEMEDGKEGVTLKNNVSDEKNIYKGASAKITVTFSEEPEVEPDKPLISKEYTPKDKQQNNIYYTIDINPYAKDLSNGDSLILKDSFITKSFTPYGGDTVNGNFLIDTLLNYVEIYEVDANGNESSEPLSPSEYSFQYFEDGQELVDFQPSKTHSTPSNEYYDSTWIFGLEEGRELKAGDIVTVTLKYDREGHRICDGSKNYIKEDGNDTWQKDITEIRIMKNDWDQSGSICINNESTPFEFNSEGYYTYTATVPEGLKVLKVTNYRHGFEDVNITVLRKKSTSELNLIIPDAKHLRIKYSYELLNNNQRPNPGDKLVFSNTATLIANDTAESSTDDTELTFAYSTAEGWTGYFPRINKRDVADSTIKLDAGFYLAKYNEDSSVWEWYTEQLTDKNPMNISAWGSRENAKLFKTINGEFNFNGLFDGSLYALEEIETPIHNDYKYEEDISKIKPYYFGYISLPETYPATGIKDEPLIPDSVRKIQSGGIIPVTNTRIIDVNVEKHWIEDKPGAIIKAKLYWSYTKVLNGFPDDMRLAEAKDLGISELSNTVEFETSYKWSGLPNGINGKPIYYYVKEMGYIIDGIVYKTTDEVDYNFPVGEFLPFYTGNGINSSNSVIEITNADTLHVEKLWHDNQNNPLPSSYLPESIDFRLYAKVNEDSEEVLVTNGVSDTFTISANDNWVCKLNPDLIKDYTIFRIEEVSPLPGYVVSYNSNYQGPTGIITIINKNSQIEVPLVDITVKKTWYDGGTNRPDSISLTLQSSEDKSTWTNVEVSQPNANVNGNEWTYTYSGLPYRNNNGKILYYRVQESVPTGYICTYGNNNGIDSGIITITNTKVITLSINKNWGDSYMRSHNGDKITVNVYRSVNEFDVTKGNDSSCLYAENIIISNTDNWTHELQNLEAYDPDGKLYYYWIKEIKINDFDIADSAYKDSYTYSNGGTSVNADNGTVTINNSYIYPPAKLPSTGGIGTAIYYILGALIGLTGLALMINLRQYILKKQ